MAVQHSPTRMACSPTPRTSIDIDAPLHVAARKKINTYRDQYANNRNITFMPSPAHLHVCTASFCVSSFYRPTARPRRTSPPSACQGNNTATHFAFAARHSYSGLNSKVGLAAAKTRQCGSISTSTDVALSLLLSTHPCAPLSSSSTSLLTTSPSPASLTSVRWPDSNEG